MKLRLLSSSLLLLALTSSAFAVAPAPVAPVMAPSKFYAGLFGGRSGTASNINVSQYGTAYYLEASGGPLAVDAFGQLNSQSASFFGLQLGYQAPELFLYPNSRVTLAPAIELEGFNVNSMSYHGALNNNTARLPEHNFVVLYPLRNTVFVANAVLGFNHPRMAVHPYIGFGIGQAISRISAASATQIDPPEAGVNHYTSNSDNTSTFAGQVKIGLSYDFTQYVSVFADYRWVYLASTSYTFGSTIYAGHPATSSWQVLMDPQRYNMGNVGVRFSC